MSQLFTQFLNKFLQLSIFSIAGLAIGSISRISPVSAQPAPTNSYIRLGSAIGLDGNTTSLGTGGLDLLISANLTGTVRLNAGFPNDRPADLGVLVGVGYNIGS